MSAEFPVEWADVEATPWKADVGEELIGETIIAAWDIDGLYDTDDEPGIFISYSRDLVPPSSLMDSRAEHRRRTCDSGETGNFNGDGLEGVYGLWAGCGSGAVTMDIHLTIRSGVTLALFIRIKDQAELPAAEQILRSIKLAYPTDFDSTGRNLPPGRDLSDLS